MERSFIELKNVKKIYEVGGQKYNALDGVDLNINQGEFVVILGPSGAGKSTLLNLLGGMDKATSGSIFIGEDDIAKFSDKELTRYRANYVGFIFQFYNIMPTLTVDENVNLIKDVTNTSKDSKDVLKSVAKGFIIGALSRGDIGAIEFKELVLNNGISEKMYNRTKAELNKENIIDSYQKDKKFYWTLINNKKEDRL